MGEKTEADVLANISVKKERITLAAAQSVAKRYIAYLKKTPGLKRIESAGSLRRKKETIGDIDILACTDKPSELSERFAAWSEVAKVMAKGETKSSVRLKSDLQVDLRIVPEDSYGAALQYFTGSKEHNVAMRRRAISMGMKLNEYGLFKGEKRVAGQDEHSVYAALKLRFIPPEKRANRGEIEEAGL
jgi:DNA polymerase (family 10)